MKLSDINPGDTVKLDGGFACHPGGLVTVYEDRRGLFFFCSDGRHYLDDQLDKARNLVGISLANKTRHLHLCRCGGTFEFSAPSVETVEVNDMSAVPSEIAALLHGVKSKCDQCGSVAELRISYPRYVSVGFIR